jgi:hypothetical protein
MEARLMNEITDEITQLAEFRSDTAPMSAQAHFRGHQRLLTEIAGSPGTARRGLRRPSRRVLIALGVVAAVTAGVIGTQIAGPGATETSAQAVSVLNQAADVLDTAPAPRPEQFVYVDVVHTTSDVTDRSDYKAWYSVDGSQAGEYRATGDWNHTATIPPHQTSTGLENAPYAVLATLPTDPDKLLRVIYSDVWVHEQQVNNHVSREVAAWSMIRDLMETACPAPQQAALFRAAAKIPHITYSESVTDAAGRVGEAVGLLDPRVGVIQLILDRNTHKFLGERVINPPGSENAGQMEFNSTVRTVAFVDKMGQLPPG